MKIINIIIIGLLALLSIAAGVAKLMQVPQEMEFLQAFGLTVTMISVFGAVQVAGGVLISLPATRTTGAVLILLTLAVSTVLIFLSGNTVFGLFSMLPIILAAIVIYQSRGVARIKAL